MARSNLDSDSAFEPAPKRRAPPKRKIPSKRKATAPKPAAKPASTRKRTASKEAAANASAEDDSKSPSAGLEIAPPSEPATNGAAAIESTAGKPTKTSPGSKKRSRSPEPSEPESLSRKTRTSPATRNKKTPSPQAPSPPAKAKSEEKDFSPPHLPATVHDKNKWQGFCEIESDPALFSVMIREMGVRGVCVREVYIAQPEFIKENIPEPLLAIILLFKFRPVDPENEVESCPDNVWFANQLPSQNSCATLAMINTLLNTQDVDLGDHLQQFKEYSRDLSPYHRGQALSTFEFVKRIHNSFAKKQDMLQDDHDLALKVAKNIKTRRGSLEERRLSASSDECLENQNHFIAFVPIDGEVWKLDGMDKMPTCLGEYDDEDYTWLDLVCDRIQAIMASAGDDGYGVLALAQSPLERLRKEMCTSIAETSAIEARLDSLNSEWKAFLEKNDDGRVPGAMTSPSLLSSLGMFADHLAAATVVDQLVKKIACEDMPELLARREAAFKEQARLQASIMEEMDKESAEDEMAKERRHDYGPVISAWLRMLAENGYIEEVLDQYM